MANAIFSKGLQGFLSGDIDWASDTIKVLACNATYTVSTSTHQYLATVASGSRLSTSHALASKTVTNGIADAADVTFTAPTAGTVTQLVIYQDTGTESTSALIAVIDTATGLPSTTNGTDNLLITWDSTSNKIFAL